MLVVSRRMYEEIVISKGTEVICITVCSIKGNVVRIGVDAERDWKILRSELLHNPPTNEGSRDNAADL